MNWWQYLLLVNIYLVLFYVFYVLLLRKETFFLLNRVYLVTASLLSFFIPLIQVNWVHNLFITQRVKYTIYSYTSNPIVISHLKPVEAHVNIGQLLSLLYGAGILLLSARFIWQLVQLKKVISQPQATNSFAFFKKIRIEQSAIDNPVIEAHEQVHAKQWHSADVLLIELVMIINWFNPVVYLYRFAIKHIHEYIADRQAVQAGTTKADYALLLLSQTFNSPAHQLVNPFFNNSLLKQRIIMLQKNKSHRISLIKYGLSVPLFILMLILSSATINNSDTVVAIKSKAKQLFLLPPVAVKNVFIDEESSSKEITAIAATVKAVKKNTEPGIVQPGAIATVSLKSSSDNVKLQPANAIVNNANQVYEAVQQTPEFPGGDEAFFKFLHANAKYPKNGVENDLQGTVIVSFVVEIDGSLSNLKVARSVNEDLDEESLRVLKLSPKWIPGTQDGKLVRAQYSVPIKFALIKTEDKKINDVINNMMDQQTKMATNTSKPGLKSIILVDGVEKDLHDIDLAKIATVRFLKGEDAYAYFGNKNIDNIVLISTKKF